jgi:hypothetical protein
VAETITDSTTASTTPASGEMNFSSGSSFMAAV